MAIRIKKYSAFRTQCFVIKALIKRQMVTRFGNYKLGALWMLIDPLVSVIVLGLVLGPFLGRSAGEIPYPFFLLCGFMQLSLITGSINSSISAIQANQGLLVFKQVQPFDAFLSRFLFELCTISLSLLIFCLLGAWFGIPLATDKLFGLVACILVSWLIGCGLGLVLGIASIKVKELEKVITYVNRPLLFLSAVLYPISSIPGEYRHILLWNPLVHTVEYSRYCLFHNYDASEVSLIYPAFVALIALTLGLMVYRNNRHFLTQR